jgi:hypothetical protein
MYKHFADGLIAVLKADPVSQYSFASINVSSTRMETNRRKPCKLNWQNFTPELNGNSVGKKERKTERMNEGNREKAEGVSVCILHKLKII